MSSGNGKGHRIPPLKVLKLKRLLCFKDVQWEKLYKIVNNICCEVKIKRKYHKHSGKNCFIQNNIIGPYIPMGKTARNLWELATDEEHTWGDLSKEEEMLLKRILMGEDPI